MCNTLSRLLITYMNSFIKYQYLFINIYNLDNNIFSNLLKCIFFIMSNKKNASLLVNTNSYLLSTYNKINNKLQYFSNLHLNNRNTYFFWYFFSQDYLINIFINLIMKEGKKYAAYKNIYKSFFFLKKITNIQPLMFLKNFLSKYRVFFEIRTLSLQTKVITLPKLLSVRSQITKSLKLVLNSFFLKNWKIKKKTLPFFKKTSYLLLNCLFNVHSIKQRILDDMKKIKYNFSYIKKEEFFHKYMKLVKNISRRRYFRVKNKSISKKMRYLTTQKRYTKKIKSELDVKQLFLLNRYNLNLKSKIKLKDKWF